MFAPLVQSIIDQHQFPVLSTEQIKSFAAEREHVVLFFSGIMKPLPETADVAVILPELLKAFDNRFSVVVVAPGDQRPLQSQYRFRRSPALVFLRHGDYVGVITGVHDWVDYQRDIATLLEAPPTEPPPYFEPDANTTGASV